MLFEIGWNSFDETSIETKEIDHEMHGCHSRLFLFIPFIDSINMPRQSLLSEIFNWSLSTRNGKNMVRFNRLAISCVFPAKSLSVR